MSYIINAIVISGYPPQDNLSSGMLKMSLVLKHHLNIEENFKIEVITFLNESELSINFENLSSEAMSQECNKIHSYLHDLSFKQRLDNIQCKDSKERTEKFCELIIDRVLTILEKLDEYFVEFYIQQRPYQFLSTIISVCKHLEFLVGYINYSPLQGYYADYDNYEDFVKEIVTRLLQESLKSKLDMNINM